MLLGDVYRLTARPVEATERGVKAHRGLELSVAIGVFKLVSLIGDSVATAAGAVVRSLGRARKGRRATSLEA